MQRFRVAESALALFGRKTPAPFGMRGVSPLCAEVFWAGGEARLCRFSPARRFFLGFGGFKETLAGSLCALLFPCRVWRVRAALCCRFCAASSRSRRRWAYRRGACRRACRPAHTRRSLRSLWAVRRGRRKIPRHCAFHSQCELVGKFARRLEAYLECGEVLDEFRLALWGDRQVFHVGRFVHENRRYPPFGVLYGGGGESDAVVRGGGLPV